MSLLQRMHYILANGIWENIHKNLQIIRMHALCINILPIFFLKKLSFLANFLSWASVFVLTPLFCGRNNLWTRFASQRDICKLRAEPNSRLFIGLKRYVRVSNILVNQTDYINRHAKHLFAYVFFFQMMHY